MNTTETLDSLILLSIVLIFIVKSLSNLLF